MMTIALPCSFCVIAGRECGNLYNVIIPIINSNLTRERNNGVSWHGVKVGLRPRDPGHRDRGPGPPSKFKSGTRDPLKV